MPDTLLDTERQQLTSKHDPFFLKKLLLHGDSQLSNEIKILMYIKKNNVQRLFDFWYKTVQIQIWAPLNTYYVTSG